MAWTQLIHQMMGSRQIDADEKLRPVFRVANFHSDDSGP